MTQELIKALKNLNLSEKESRVWLSCLEIGESTAYNLAVKSGLSRALVYDILERLIKLTIISATTKNNTKYFRTTEPEKLIEMLKEREEEIKKVIPELKNLQNKIYTKEPQVEIYEGKNGMKNILNDIINSGIKEFFRYGCARISFDVLPFFAEKWTKERIKSKISAKYIYDDTKEAREKIKKNKEALKFVDYRFLPVNLESQTTILIYENKVVFSSWTKEPFAVLIKSKELADNQKKYFKKLWDLAKD